MWLAWCEPTSEWLWTTPIGPYRAMAGYPWTTWDDGRRTAPPSLGRGNCTRTRASSLSRGAVFSASPFFVLSESSVIVSLGFSDSCLTQVG